MYSNLINLEKKIQYKFTDINILKLSLTHRSYSIYHNERLEFLGDSLLNFIITKYIYKQFSFKKEGYMTRIRSNLVNSKNLLKIAKTLKLNKYILLGQGEIKMKGQYKKSILSNTVEAILGAIFIDSQKLLIVEKIIYILFIKTYNQKQIHLINNKKDPKTILQEYLQKYNLPLPQYLLINKTGLDHKQIFTVQCIINNFNKYFLGIGNNKKEAEQIAAKKTLIKLGIL